MYNKRQVLDDADYIRLVAHLDYIPELVQVLGWDSGPAPGY